jgi:hypothetical protein
LACGYSWQTQAANARARLMRDVRGGGAAIAAGIAWDAGESNGEDEHRIDIEQPE